MRLIDADALYNGTMKDEYFDYVSHDNHGRESFAYSCAMQRLAEAPTIDAIPVEWIENMLKEWRKSSASFETCGAISAMLVRWQKEQEAQNG